jgi:DegV family protein with EDD domain
MGKIGIVTDSTAYLPFEFKEKYQIEVVSLVVNYDDKSIPEEGIFYKKLDDFYNWLYKASVLPTTSQPSTGDFIEIYQKLSKRVDSIISIHISGGISGTVSTAAAVAQMLPDLDITVINSGSTSIGLYMAVHAAARTAAAGLGKEKVLENVRYVVDNLQVVFIPATLEYLKRGGRIGGAAALLGNLLQIKPILYFNPERDYIIDVYEKVRTKEKGIRRMLSEMKEAWPYLKTAVAHVASDSEGEDLLKRVKEICPDTDPLFSSVGPVIGSHIGPGTVGIAWYPLTPELDKLVND